MKLQSVAQAGLTFSENSYDRDRYEQVRSLAVEIMHEYTGISHEKLGDIFAGETGYQTPKIDVRAAVFRDGKILMVREKVDGKWSLPGGWADVNSSLSESVIRECQEEAGANVTPKRIIAIQLANRQNNSRLPYTIYKIFVECDLVSVSFRENTETLESDFFAPDSLPELSTNRNTSEQIEMCFRAKEQKLLEPVFD